MPKPMILQISLRKEVEDEEVAQQVYELVCSRLADHPDVAVSGHLNQTLELEPPPPE